MKNTAFVLAAIFSSLLSPAQYCPGGGTDFSTAEFFDYSWIYLCNTGTSCSGGRSFDNRSSCEPTTAIDACAPAPTCGNLPDMGSDLWFKFYATTSNAVINVIQNVSFYASIQVFSSASLTPTCSDLTQIGCVVAGGPSSGVSISLTSLTPGNLYFFRVYGTANNPSQRSGVFCFCGSSGLTDVVLPVRLTSFTASLSGNTMQLKWSVDQQRNFSHFDIEKSNDGINFVAIGKQPAIYNGSSRVDYHFEEKLLAAEDGFYRLKMVNTDGKYGYSDIVKTNNKTAIAGFSIKRDNANRRIVIYSDTNSEAEIYTSTGNKLATYHLVKGTNYFYEDLKPGLYIIRKKDTGKVQKFTVY